MSVVRIPPVLRAATGGMREVQVAGDTVAEVLDRLYEQHPGVRAQLQTDDGELVMVIHAYQRLIDEEDGSEQSRKHDVGRGKSDCRQDQENYRYVLVQLITHGSEKRTPRMIFLKQCPKKVNPL